MKASIDREGCIGCTLCATICPDVFFMADDGKADVSQTPVPESARNSAQSARDQCPVSVIDIEE
ncbi:MAG: ferredoxin [Oscillospiraceae bacterium]|nr:ferredoxin [Oscillospiraceae bacterium]